MYATLLVFTKTKDITAVLLKLANKTIEWEIGQEERQKE